MSKKLNLSPWHDWSVKPVHVGVYERKYGGAPWYSMWDGLHWRNGESSVLRASQRKGITPIQKEQWRGVLK